MTACPASKYFAAALLAIALAGCGAGSPSLTPPTVSPPVMPMGSSPSGPALSGPAARAEFNAQPSLAAINADQAYARGFTGQGVTIAVLDNPLPEDHPEFDNPAQKFTRAYDDRVTIAACESSYGHGARVASVAGADRDGQGIHGVAYDARIAGIDFVTGCNPPRFYTKTPPGLFGDASWGVRLERAVASGAPVLNVSLGFLGLISDYDDADRSALEATAFDRSLAALRSRLPDSDQRQIRVIAAGNSHNIFRDADLDLRLDATDPGVIAGLPVLFADLLGTWIVAVAVEVSDAGQAGGITGFSNRCGVAAAFCLAAPGANIRTVGYDHAVGDAPDVVRGTSFAAPHIAGAVAILLQQFPGLGHEEIVTRLFATANKQAPYDDEAIYGQGLLDLARATRPSGVLRIARQRVVDGLASPLSSSALLASAALGDALERAAGGRTLAVFDALDAPFFLPLPALVGAVRNRNDSAERLAHLAEAGAGAGARVLGPVRLFALHRERFDAGLPGGLPGGLSSPYLGLADGGILAGLSGSGAERRSASAGVFINTPAETSGGGEAQASGMILRRPLPGPGGMVLGLQAGVVIEDKAALGTQAQGAFGPFERTETFFTGLDAALPVTEAFSLFAAAHAGWTRAPSIEAAGLLQEVSPLLTSAFEIGLAGSGIVREGDRLALRLSQPLRVERGEGELAWPTGRRPDRSVVFARETIELAPSGRGLDLELAYALPFERGRFGFALAVSREAGHVRARGAEFSAALFFLRRF